MVQHDPLLGQPIIDLIRPTNDTIDRTQTILQPAPLPQHILLLLHLGGAVAAGVAGVVGVEVFADGGEEGGARAGGGDGAVDAGVFAAVFGEDFAVAEEVLEFGGGGVGL